MKCFSLKFQIKKEPAANTCLAAGSRKLLVVFFLLLSVTVEPSNHDRQRAALMPMMVGMMVRMVAVLSSNEAHEFQLR
jgi:hypothetical protein